MLGIRLSVFTPEILDDILKIYERIAGGYVNYPSAPTPEVRLQWIKERLGRSNCVADWRFGSRLIWKGKEDADAKFCVWNDESLYERGKRADEILRFSFDPNIVSGEAADAMKSEFADAVDAYLSEKGLAVPLKKRA